uniref:Uncharacterized protein n=1 Tax=Euplotes crassus TaxID=5936 RepID=A0A7S3KM14_EUPCR|mmetsp:Transcript_3482/g.3223  ORF Transcript_3482/g.3223 Transcript_3482/m.3223 type:complete len:221 (+) Transcript_3482:280-942(+)
MHYLRYINDLVFYDSHALFFPSDGPSSEHGGFFINDLLGFLSKIILQPISRKVSEKALEVLTNLLKDLTNYEDKQTTEKKSEMSVPVGDKCIIGNSECEGVLAQLDEVSSSIICDYIFQIDLTEAPHDLKVIVAYISEMMFIRVKLDQTMTETLRKYWKSKGTDYRCILEIKEALEVAIKEEEETDNYIYVKNELTSKICQSLKDNSMKVLLSSGDNVYM